LFQKELSSPRAMKNKLKNKMEKKQGTLAQVETEPFYK
jgi:hypothetical protein